MAGKLFSGTFLTLYCHFNFLTSLFVSSGYVPSSALNTVCDLEGGDEFGNDSRWGGGAVMKTIQGRGGGGWEGGVLICCLP